MESSVKQLSRGIKLNFYKGLFTKQKRIGTLSATEVFSLDVIRLLGRPTIGAFAKFINVPLSNATYKINTLIEKGFIRKRKSERDKREFYLELTEKCNSINLDEASQNAVIDRIEKRLSPNQQEALEQILNIIDEEIKNETLIKENNNMSKKIVLCADHTCDLGEELLKKYNVHTIPYHISLEDKDYLDSVTITTGELYKAFYDRKVLPKTSAVNIGDFNDFWKPFLDEGCEIIHINLGSAISSTHRNACLAAEELEGVYPVDSQNLSSGMGHVVIEAAKLIEQGLEAKEIVEKLKEITTRVHSTFVLDTLEFMHAGGRCSTVAALGANLLKLKPCIVVDNLNGSAMGVGKKYRGEFGNVLISYTKDQLSKYNDILTDKIFITHTDIDPKYVEIVKKTINETMEFDEIYETDASCTIGSHCGPGTLGILFMTKS